MELYEAFEILGISGDTSEGEFKVKRARILKESHPDGGVGDSEKFLSVMEAIRVVENNQFGRMKMIAAEPKKEVWKFDRELWSGSLKWETKVKVEYKVSIRFTNGNIFEYDRVSEFKLNNSLKIVSELEAMKVEKEVFDRIEVERFKLDVTGDRIDQRWRDPIVSYLGGITVLGLFRNENDMEMSLRLVLRCDD